ncbi:MAG: tRNA pseudouridine(55) synthase TruB [Gammaproteobacteria bacterium]|nr:tRNA pseudouridine(55) synthase TruB [Gammaproteobacteria bacterium]RPG22895.1 MAG: tRNA pseudouridine(55) synthase TruB [Gammaproteobacteria bacterium TMED57]
MARRRKGRPVNGILVVDKPAGISSNDVVQQAKRLFGAQKVGHTGSLDPLATGVLPLCFGEATKFSQYLLDANKTYWTRIRLGVSTETGDADGEVIAQVDATAITQTQVSDALETFVGEIEQIPSMYSALKHQGQPLYKLARQGIEVERAPRTVTIYSAELLQFAEAYIELRVHCSKGTYIRSLAEDLGAALGCGGHVSALRRLAAGPYAEAQAVTLEQVSEIGDPQEMDALLLPVASAVGSWPSVRLHEDTAHYVRQGQPVQVAHAPTHGWVQIFESAEEDRFLGVGEVLTDGRIAPRRLVASD